ncbi:hypothetical protein ONZ45_g18456 [Pleurotus djamor]|nr:hypothetical protein ONZ45_g18456 [Pleurotus djamor]
MSQRLLYCPNLRNPLLKDREATSMIQKRMKEVITLDWARSVDTVLLCSWLHVSGKRGSGRAFKKHYTLKLFQGNEQVGWAHVGSGMDGEEELEAGEWSDKDKMVKNLRDLDEYRRRGRQYLMMLKMRGNAV